MHNLHPRHLIQQLRPIPKALPAPALGLCRASGCASKNVVNFHRCHGSSGAAWDAWSSEFVNTVAPRPYESLAAAASASSKLGTQAIAATGPKVSLSNRGIPGLTLSNED